ncbi:MAG: 4-oxalocrotonate tautomerase [Promethearchaeota archaeon]|nr:MAG: 4-oxalocrotonate tautomerase [Candidatus Lokiarchaeota archaeon]
MPLVQVSVWKGFSEENIKKVIVGMTKVLTDMGIPSQAVEVIVQEIPKSHWGVNGLPATESLPDAKVPK